MQVLRSVVILSVVLFLALSTEAAAQTLSGKTADTQTSPKVTEATVAEQPTAQPTLAPETQSVHIQVGRLIVLNTQSRLRRIVISNPAVLDTVTVSTTQVVVTAKTPGSSSLVLWDESSNVRILDVYADINVAGLRDGVRSEYPSEAVQIEAEQGKILVTGKVSSKTVADDILRTASV
jgi:pilus assembly protein CpaC